MKLFEAGATISALLLLQASLIGAKHAHSHLNALERRHRHHSRDGFESKEQPRQELELRADGIEKRDGQCQFPTNAGLVAVTPDSSNAGWALSPDQQCLPGNYCPYACPSGQMMAQWDPSATSYSYPKSQNGGLYCGTDGSVSKPFPDQPYCMTGTGNVGVNNKASSSVAFCQTVLPGNEAMLIPTSIEQFETLTVPGPNYWCGTAAHFYINPPGISTDEACVWGSSANPYGNWSPYVAGANTVDNGETFVKLGWNPIYLQPQTPFNNVLPTWGVEIVCDGPGCNGLPCAIDPSQNQVNQMVGANTDGAGGAAFCVVTVPKGVNANFEVFEGSISNAGSGSSPSASATTTPSVAAQKAAVIAVSSSSATPTPSSTSTPPPSSSSAAASTTSSPPPSTSTSSTSSVAVSSSTSIAPSTSSTYSIYISSSSVYSSNSTTLVATSTGASISSSATAISSYPSYSGSPQSMGQNSTATFTAASLAQTASATSTGGIADGTPASINNGHSHHATAAGLCLSVVAILMTIAL